MVYSDNMMNPLMKPLKDPSVKVFKERKKHDRFNGMPEEEVSKRTLPDHLTQNLDIVIVSWQNQFWNKRSAGLLWQTRLFPGLGDIEKLQGIAADKGNIWGHSLKVGVHTPSGKLWISWVVLGNLESSVISRKIGFFPGFSPVFQNGIFQYGKPCICVCCGFFDRRAHKHMWYNCPKACYHNGTIIFCTWGQKMTV